LILTNPPYGERLDDDQIEDLYAAIASSFRRFTGWRAGVLVANPIFERVAHAVLGPPRIKKPLANANLRAYFLLYEL
jgi:23S rRNA G2445 N2-methylase RlmL